MEESDIRYDARVEQRIDEVGVVLQARVVDRVIPAS
jgi:hypothetical protein